MSNCPKLTDDPLWNIFRYRSKKPYDKLWMHSISHDDALNFLEAVHFLKPRFDSLGCDTLLKENMLSLYAQEPDDEGADLQQLRQYRLTIFTKFAKEIGKFCKALFLSSTFIQDADFKWDDMIKNHFPNLEKLSYDQCDGPSQNSAFTNILKERKSKLKTLILTVGSLEEDIKEAVCAHAVGVTNFDIIFITEEPGTTKYLIEILDSIGLHLTNLKMTLPENVQDCKELLGRTHESCPKIEHLSFSAKGDSSMESIAEYCQKYGDKLESLTLRKGTLKPELWKAIAEKCPSVLVTTKVRFEDLSSTLESLGTRAHTLEIIGEASRATPVKEQLFNIAYSTSRCCLLHKLIIDIPGNQVSGLIEAFLKRKKTNPKHIQILNRPDFQIEAIDVDNILEVLSKNTADVQHLLFRARCLSEKSCDLFRDFANLNKELERVTIGIDQASATAAESIKNAFPRGPKLVELFLINGHEKIDLLLPVNST